MIGGKAEGLNRLRDAGFRTPDYFVIPDESFAPGDEPPEALERWLNDRGTKTFAVRSSAENEDSAMASYAGLFLTRLNVTHSEIPAAMRAVRASAQGRRMAVIVQTMLQPTSSGVAFSRAPIGNSGDVVIEAATGLGVGVVEGKAATESWRWNRLGGFVERTGPPILDQITAHALTELVLRVEARLGYPVDIEWAIDSTGLQLLQARPITTELPELVYLTDFNLAESYPGFSAPLTCDFVRLMYKQVFTDCARFLGANKERMRALLPHYETLIEDVDGHLYYNMHSYAGALLPMPRGDRAFDGWKKMVGVPSHIDTPVPAVQPAAPLERLRTVWRLAHFGFRQKSVMEEYLHRATKKMQSLDAKKTRAEGEPAVAIVRMILAEIDSPQDLALGIFNDYFIMNGQSEVQQDIDGLESLKPEIALEELRSGISKTDLRTIEEVAAREIYEPQILLAKITDRVWKARLEDFLSDYGSRCFGDLKLETQTFRQNVAPLCRLLVSSGARVPLASRKGRASRFSRSVRYRETCRLLRTRYFAWAREMFLLASRELKKEVSDWRQEDIFNLRLLWLREFAAARITGAELCKRVNQTTLEAREYPSLIALDRGHFHLPLRQETRAVSTHDLRGMLVAGDRGEGRVLIVDDPAKIPGQLDLSEFYLVTPTTDPAWVYHLSRCRGIISERGNALSHLAIIARELKKTMVVQVEGACRTLESNQCVALEGEGPVAVIAVR